MKYILLALLAYIIFRFVFNFLVPVFKTTRQIKKGFHEMNSRMQQQGTAPAPEETKVPKDNEGDYIDFEEIK